MPKPVSVFSRRRAVHARVASILIGAATFIAAATAAAEDVAPVPVRVGRVTRSEVGAERVFIGTVEAARKSTVGSPVAGRVAAVPVEEGDAVVVTDDKAALLVQLEPDAANIALSAAQAALDVAKHERAELVAGPRPQEIRRLEADVRSSQSQLTLQTKSLRRLESLFERSAVGQSELDAGISAQRAAEEAVRVTQAHLEEAQAGTRPEQLAQSAAREMLAQQEVLRLEDLLTKHAIRAPFSGYVVQRYVEQGAWVQQGDPVMEILELDPVEVRVAVPEEFVSRIAVGASVRVDVAAVLSADPEASVLIGSVFRIVPSGDVRTRAFPVRVRIDNPVRDGLPLLKPGMLARVHLPVGQGEESLLVPRDALVLDGERASIFILEKIGIQETAREVPIDIGSAHDALIQIRPARGSQLTADVSVVTEGNEQLTSGQSVTVLDSPIP